MPCTAEAALPRTELAVGAGTSDGAAVDAAAAAGTALSASCTVRQEGMPQTPTRRPSARETILDAAEAVVATDGAAHLTLDAVAERGGVSKGGLLYHFPTKELLLEAMVDRHTQQFEATRLRALAGLPLGPGRELKALILSALPHCAQKDARLSCGMLAAATNSPHLLDPVRAAKRRRLEWITTGEPELPFARAASIALAVDGMCLLEMLQVSPYDAGQRERIMEDLLRLVDETAAEEVRSQNAECRSQKEDQELR